MEKQIGRNFSHLINVNGADMMKNYPQFEKRIACSKVNWLRMFSIKILLGKQNFNEVLSYLLDAIDWNYVMEERMAEVGSAL